MEFDPHTWEHEISEASSSRKDNAKSARNFLEKLICKPRLKNYEPKTFNSETHENVPTFHNPDNYYFTDKRKRKEKEKGEDLTRCSGLLV